MTARESRVARCPFCETVQPVGDFVRAEGETEGGRHLLIHAAFAVRCEGSGSRAWVHWRPGENPFESAAVL